MDYGCGCQNANYRQIDIVEMCAPAFASNVPLVA
jgi:hypothetical protein